MLIVTSPVPGEAGGVPFSPGGPGESQYRSKLKQFFNQLILWTQDNWQTARSVESFAEQLLRKVNSLANEADRESEPSVANIIIEKVEPIGSVMCPVSAGQRHPLFVPQTSANVAIAMPPVLRSGNNTRPFDPLAPPGLLPVVPPPMQSRPGPAFPTGIFPPQPLRITTNPNNLPDQVPEIFWQQQAHQALLMQPLRPQSTSLGTILPPPPIQPQTSPQVIFQQNDMNLSPIIMSETRVSDAPPIRRVTFPQTSDTSDDNYRSRPKRLYLGVSNSGNSSVTPSTPHAGNYSTVSTPHGANTPAGDATPIDMCSPTAVKPFPDSTYGNQLREPLPMASPGVQPSPLTSPRPQPRSLSLGHMNPLSPGLPPYSRGTAITPQRQIFAHSLLELAQHGQPPSSQALGQELDSGRDVVIMSTIPGQSMQAPPLLAPNDEGLNPLQDIGTPTQGGHMRTPGDNMLTALSSQQSNMLQFTSPGLPMPGRGGGYNQIDMAEQPQPQPLPTIPRSQPVLPPNSLPLGEAGSSENIMTTPCDPNMGAPPNLSVATEEDLDIVSQSRAAHAPGNQPWPREEGSESSGPDHEIPRPQNDSADSLLMLSGKRTV